MVADDIMQARSPVQAFSDRNLMKRKTSEFCTIQKYTCIAQLLHYNKSINKM